MADALSFERMFCYRAAGLAGYIALFYALVAVGLPGWVALVTLIGATAIVTFFICHWREGDSWLKASAFALPVLAFCGAVPAMLINDKRPANVPDWSLFGFSLCASEAVFFLSALGVFGTKVADLPLAIACGVTMFMVQVCVLAAGFQYCSKPVVKNRWDD